MRPHWYPLFGFAAFAALALGSAFADPVLSVSLRGIANATVEQGEPVTLFLQIASPRADPEPIAIAPSTGDWTGAVQVDLAPLPTGPAVATASVVGRADSTSLAIDATSPAGGLWHFSSETMSRLAPGDYLLSARLSVAAGSGWTGTVSARSIPLKVVAASNDPKRSAQSAVARAAEAIRADQLPAAAEILDAALQLAPGDRDVLMMRSIVCERAGNLAAALFCANRAARGLPPGVPPPSGLHDLTRRLQARLQEPVPNEPLPALPAWSYAPPVLLAELARQAKAYPATAAVAAPAPRALEEKAARVPPPAALATPPGSAPLAIAPVAESAPKSAAGAAGEGSLLARSELVEAAILAQANAQWASSARASSQYGSGQYSAMQATGAPNISVAGDSPQAWAPANKNSGIEWLEVGFERPARAIALYVRQNNAPGTITRVEAIEPDGTTHLWWAGRDPYEQPAVREIAWFGVVLPLTDYRVAKVKLTLDLGIAPDWKEIDAVLLVAAEP